MYGIAHIEPHIVDFRVSRSIDENETFTHNVGTPYYQAPEVEVYNDDYDYFIDIYSLGIIYFSNSSTIHMEKQLFLMT